MIPKIIHLCWFSGDPYPDLIKNCIKSWEREMPDYKIRLWDEKSARELNIKYINQALDKKKYAFAADVVRLVALYKEGGIYLDSDIYLKKSLEPILDGDFVTVMEFHESIVKPEETNENGEKLIKDQPVSGIGIQAAFLASTPHHPLIKKILSYYENRDFIRADMSLDTDIIAPSVYAGILEDVRFKYSNKKQYLDHNTIIYPSHYISGNINYDHSKSIGIHCCQHSWFKFSRMKRLKRYCRKVLTKLGLYQRHLKFLYN